MVLRDENALVCDFAETYHIYDWRSLPMRFAATLAAGLRPDSRIMLKLSGTSAPANELLLSIVADAVRVLVWQNSKDGIKGRNPPVSLFERLIGSSDTTADSVTGFDSPEEFMAWREKMTGGDTHG